MLSFFLVPLVVDAIKFNHVEVFIRKKYERRVAFLFEFFCFVKILRIDDPDGRARKQFLAMLDQLHELVIAPHSPFAAHKDEHHRLARAQFLRKRAQFAQFVRQCEIRSHRADSGRGLLAGVSI